MTTTAKSKALKGEKRYTPAKMPKDGFVSASHAQDFYKNHKGKMVSSKVNPKTGKYANTY